MKTISACYCFLLISVSLLAQQPGPAESLHPKLEPLRPLIGKTWKGVFKNSTPEKPVIDISRWERALNGNAVRVLHSINGGVYGGETLFVWNEQKQSVEYHYFTTAGFMTVGTLKVEAGKMISHEKVTGSAGGVTEVKSTIELEPEGGFRIRAEHLKSGEWVAGRDTTYKEAPGEEVKFH